MFHNLSYLKGERENSGIDILMIYPSEEDKRNEKMMLYKCYQKILQMQALTKWT